MLDCGSGAFKQGDSQLVRRLAVRDRGVCRLRRGLKRILGASATRRRGVWEVLGRLAVHVRWCGHGSLELRLLIWDHALAAGDELSTVLIHQDVRSWVDDLLAMLLVRHKNSLRQRRVETLSREAV